MNYLQPLAVPVHLNPENSSENVKTLVNALNISMNESSSSSGDGSSMSNNFSSKAPSINTQESLGLYHQLFTSNHKITPKFYLPRENEVSNMEILFILL